jgi:hypothetical protein
MKKKISKAAKTAPETYGACSLAAKKHGASNQSA